MNKMSFDEEEDSKSESGSVVLPDYFPVLQEKVANHDLYVLGNLLEELRDHVESGHNNEAIGNSLSAAGPYPRGMKSTRKTQMTLDTFCQDLETALSFYDDQKLYQKVMKNEDQIAHFLKLLSSKGKFDVALEAYRMMKRFHGEIIFKGIQKLDDREIPGFQLKNPVERYQKKKETGFKREMKTAKIILSADEANELGRKAWKNKLKWQAELWWERATEIDPHSTAKYWSNLAFIRTQLGRYLRSLELGYRSLGDKRIKLAISAAQRSIEIDPYWERGYQRAAEAHLALGPYDHAMEACRILQQAFNTLEEPSNVLRKLQKEAKDRALLWCSLGVPPAIATIPRLLDSALSKLRSAILESLSLHATSVDEDSLSKIGNKISDQLSLVHAILQLQYLRRSQWIRECAAADMDVVYIQQELVQAAKLVPVNVVINCGSLRQMVLMEDPFTFWGLDRLDRAGVTSLAFDAEDPCKEDETDQAVYAEMIKRQTGGLSTTLSEAQSTADMVTGPTVNSIERDYARHHLCAFTFMVLHRFLREPRSPLFGVALLRLLKLTMTKNGNAFSEGGDFIGMAINAALGIEKFDLRSKPDHTLEVLRIPGGIFLAAVEISQSGDENFRLQKALASLSPREWSKCDTVDVRAVFVQYIFNLLDGTMIIVEEKDEATYLSYAEEILASILDGNPDVIDYLRNGTDSERIQHLPLLESQFGVYLGKRYSENEKLLNAKGHTATTKDIVSRIIEKWNKLTVERKSAYRWESLSERTKQELALIKPKTKFQIEKAKRKGRDLKQEDEFFVKKLPECAWCGKGGGLGVVLHHCSSCLFTNYCSKTCQKEDFAKHKKICKKLRVSKVRTER